MDTPSPSALLERAEWCPFGPRIAGAVAGEVAGFVAGWTRNEDIVALAGALAGVERRYVLVMLIASSPSSAVYVAVDRLLTREVAIKIHRPDLVFGCWGAIDEAQIQASVADHPNVVQVLDSGEWGDWWYTVTVLCDGSLADYCKDEGRGWTEIVDRILEAGAGLGHLHRLGLAHGDLKPWNVLVSHDVAMLGDFGQTREFGARGVGGTVGYVAPELEKGGVSEKSDVFALAVTAWYCLFGELPYGRLSGDRKIAGVQAIERAVERRIVRPERLPEGMPVRVVYLLEWGLEPVERYRCSLEGLLAGLREVRDGGGVRVGAAAREVMRTQVQPRRRSMIGAAAGLMLVSFAGGYVVAERDWPGSAGMWALLEPPTRAGLGARREAVVWSLLDPLARAELAARMGDGARAVRLLYGVYGRRSELGGAELERAAAVALRVSVILESGGDIEGAELAGGVGQVLWR